MNGELKKCESERIGAAGKSAHRWVIASRPAQAAAAAAAAASNKKRLGHLLLVACYVAVSFGSYLLELWSHDHFWW